jgi:hypothetical protein
MRDAFRKQIAALKFKPKRKLVLIPKKAPVTSGLPPEILAFAEQNFKLFPVKVRDKTPLIKGWPSLATNEVAQLEKWARQFPNCNWGAKTGDGIVVLDVDGLAGRMAIRAWEAVGLRLPSTRIHSTGKGQHLLFTTAAPVRNSAGKLAPGLDVRGEVGYIVMPPSVHPSGAPYKTTNGAPLANLPDWLRKKMLAPASSAKAAAGVIPQGQRDNALTSAAGTLRRAGRTQAEIESALTALNAEQCKPPKSEEDVARISASVGRYPIPDGVQAALNGPRPKVLLPGDDRLLSDFAAELGGHLADKPIFVHAGEVVTLHGCALRPVTAQILRTLVEGHLVCIKQRRTNKVTVDVGSTMAEADSRGVLASEQFRGKLRRLQRINSCRLPVFRSNGHLELLPEGFDAATGTLTVSDVNYAEDMPLSTAVDTITDLFSEFHYADGERSRAVAIASLVSLYSAQLLPEGTLRPVFIATKNAEGAGASTIAACAIVPVIGQMPSGSKPADDDEMRKLLLATVREGRAVLLLDNIKGRIDSAALENFVSAVNYHGRVLGASETLTVPNLVTVFCTANGASTSPDMRRRSLRIWLHLDVERAEDRQFVRPLSEPVLQSMRPQILAACWTMVRHWCAQGRPAPRRGSSSFPELSQMIGGIVQAAGFGCALETPVSETEVFDEDGGAMRVLVAAMRPDKRYTFQEIVTICQHEEIFTNLTGAAMTNTTRTTLSRVLGRYDDRIVGDRRFATQGKGHQRKYRAEAANSTSTMTRSSTMFPPEIIKTHVSTHRVKHRVSSCHRASGLSIAKPSLATPKFTRAGRANISRGERSNTP